MNNQELEKRNKTLEKRWKVLLVIAIVFLITRPVALFVVNKILHKAVDEATTNEYPLIDPARKYIPQENYIVNLDALRHSLLEIGNQYPDSVSIYYEQLNSGTNISINSDLHFYPASLNKLAQAMIAADKVADKEWSWDIKLTIQQQDIDSGSGNLFKTVKAGESMTLDDIVKYLLVDSDNTAQNVLRRNLKIEEYSELQGEVGLEELFDEMGEVNTKEYSRMFRTLYTSSYLERQESQKLLTFLSESTFHDYISQGIPDGVEFAHKYGENKERSIFADSGIVYIPGKPYLITVMIKGKDSSDETRKWAIDIMKEISKKAYDAGKEKVGYNKFRN